MFQEFQCLPQQFFNVRNLPARSVQMLTLLVKIYKLVAFLLVTFSDSGEIKKSFMMHEAVFILTQQISRLYFEAFLP